MRWEDERWVRLYTRSGPEWNALSFEARGLFCLLLREVDRAGILALGKLGPRAIAVQVRVAFEVIEAAIGELERDGAILIAEGKLVIPNFLEAQEVPASDKARKAKERELARLIATNASTAQGVTPRDDDATERDATNTARDEMSQPGHARSRRVTTRQDETRRNKTKRNKTRREIPPGALALPGLDLPVLPFKPAEAAAMLARASGGRFVAPSTMGKGSAIRLVELIKAYPRRETWETVGAWLAAGGEGWRGKLDLRWLVGGENFNAVAALADDWWSAGQPAIGGKVRDVSEGMAPVSKFDTEGDQ